MEPSRRGKLEIEDRARGQETKKYGMDPNSAEDLAGEEDIDGKSRALVAAQHQHADNWRDDEVDERVPGMMAAEVEPMTVEEQRQRMERRAGQQRDGQQP